MVKGSKVPMGLFTYDMDMDAAIGAAQDMAGSPAAAPAAGSEPIKRIGSSRHFGASSSKLSAAAAAAAAGGGASSCVDAEACEMLLSSQWEDEWLDNPVLASSWALTGPYKQQWDAGFEVRDMDWGLWEGCSR